MPSGRLRRAERWLGPYLRRVVNMLSGNYFARIDGRLDRIEKALAARRPKAAADRLTQDLYNRQQEETVERFRLALKEQAK